MTPGSLQKGQTLANRYRVDEPLPEALGERGFCGTDTNTNLRVRLLRVDPDAAQRVKKAICVTHPHLAKLEAVVQIDEGTAVLVEELVDGTPLADRLKTSGPQVLVDTVKSALRIADALAAVHAQDSAHGEVVPAAVLLEPVGRSEPTLRHLGLLRLPDGYARPEREEGEPFDIADDAWAIAALLYEMLVGRAPAAKGLEEDSSLNEAVPDPSLREVLESYLKSSPEERRATLGHFKRVLARWYAEHAGEEAVVVSTHPHHEPPPLPASAPVGPQGRRSRAPSPSLRRRLLILVLALTAVGLLVGLAAAWTYSAIDRRTEARSEPPVPGGPANPAPSRAAAPPAVNLSEIPVTGSRDPRARDERTSCVAGFLPKGSLDENAALQWLCSEADAAVGAAKLKLATRPPEGSGRGNLGLGWYWIPMFALVQQGCCSESGPLRLPESSASCPSASQALKELTRRVAGSESLAEPLDRFTEAMECESRAGRAHDFSGELGLREGPEAEARKAFTAIVEQLAQP